jgi:hypothetical protein
VALEMINKSAAPIAAGTILWISSVLGRLFDPWSNRKA